MSAVQNQRGRSKGIDAKFQPRNSSRSQSAKKQKSEQLEETTEILQLCKELEELGNSAI